MFEARSCKKELTDDLTLEGDASIKNMRELEGVNFWLGGTRALISAFNEIYRKHSNLLRNQTTVIADLGCGCGDLLRDIHRWAKAKELNVDLIGIDASPFVARRAVEESRSLANIQFKTADVLSDAFQFLRFDIVCLNSFCHHLSDADLITLLKRLKQQTRLAIIINDLHRHWFSYLSIQWIARLFHFSYLSIHDGPLSVLRAFQKHELIKLLAAADLDDYHIRWRWAFRWEIVIWLQ